MGKQELADFLDGRTIRIFESRGNLDPTDRTEVFVTPTNRNAIHTLFFEPEYDTLRISDYGKEGKEGFLFEEIDPGRPVFYTSDVRRAELLWDACYKIKTFSERLDPSQEEKNLTPCSVCSVKTADPVKDQYKNPYCSIGCLNEGYYE